MRNHSFFLCVVVGLLLTSCSMKSPRDTRTIIVSIEPLRYFAEQIAGDRFVIKSMVPKGSNPETYEPTASQMIDLSKSDMYVKVGQIGFERAWMKKLEKNAPHTIIIDSSEGIEMINTLHGHPDPHTWMSTQNAVIIARNIYRALSAVDAKDSLFFKSNLENLVSRINILDTHIREQLTRDKSTAFLVYHPSLTYFARDYRLRQIPIEEEGREPSVSQLMNTVKIARESNAKCLFLQKEFDNRNTRVVAKETGVEVIKIDPLNYHWEDEMLRTAKKLK